ncbi:MAG: tetratricopeptide repeat protein [Proteobacteria bacterium]|nr:tetratricopeptide repeat protein [Pseudomonadota bacterium]
MATSKKKTIKTKHSKKPPRNIPSEVTTEDPSVPDELQKDKLDDFLFHAANYMYVKRKMFSSLAAAFVVILVAGYGIFRFVEYRDDLRNEELYRIERQIHDYSLSEGKRFAKTVPLLDNFVDSHSGSKQYIIALFYRGSLYFKNNRFKDAERDLNTVLLELDNESELFILASVYLSNILRDQQKMGQAIEVLQTARTDKMTDVILMELTEVYLSMNRKDDAKLTLEVLLKDYPKSVYNTQAKQLLKTL